MPSSVASVGEPSASRLRAANQKGSLNLLRRPVSGTKPHAVPHAKSSMPASCHTPWKAGVQEKNALQPEHEHKHDGSPSSLKGPRSTHSLSAYDDCVSESEFSVASVQKQQGKATEHAVCVVLNIRPLSQKEESEGCSSLLEVSPTAPEVQGQHHGVT